MTNDHNIKFSLKTVALILIFLITGAVDGFAQEQDLELWTSIEVEKRLNKKLRLTFEEQARFNENISGFFKFNSDIGISYRINKYVKIGANYRLEQKKQPENYYSTRHRFTSDLILRYEVARFLFSYRNRYQHKYVDLYSSEDGSIPRTYNRSRIQAEYNIRKNPLTPYISYEFYFKLNNFEYNEIDTHRYTVGFEYSLNKRNDLDLYFRILKHVNVNRPVTSNIIGISYCYSF